MKIRNHMKSIAYFIWRANKLPWFINSYKKFKALNKSDIYPIMQCKPSMPLLSDIGKSAGNVSYYLTQDLWGARKIFELPKEIMHYDIGSRLDGFITHLLSFRSNITLIDIRPLPYKIDSDLNFIQADATNLENIPDKSIHSLSALCSIEHFGLGRYGDPIDPFAYLKAITAIQRVIAKKGRVYISVPIGRERIEFNGHRIFYPQTIIKCFDKMELIEFSVAKEDSKMPLIKNANIDDYNDWDMLTGLFEFKKK